MSLIEKKLIDWLKSDNQRLEALQIARGIALPNWCISAGFVRNLVWDKLHQYTNATPLNDIDLIYYDNAELSEEKDNTLEYKLSKISPLPWSVKNQARMHLRNNDSQYLSSEDAMCYWPEIETAIGVKLDINDEIEIIAPFGVKALFNKTVTMNQFHPKPEIFKQRIRDKAWLKNWPLLEVKLI